MQNLDSTHPWQSAVDHWNDAVMPLLKQHGQAIGAKAACGDKDALKIVQLYTMLTRSFDPMTAIQIEELLKKVIP